MPIHFIFSFYEELEEKMDIHIYNVLSTNYMQGISASFPNIHNPHNNFTVKCWLFAPPHPSIMNSGIRKNVFRNY